MCCPYQLSPTHRLWGHSNVQKLGSLPVNMAKNSSKPLHWYKMLNNIYILCSNHMWNIMKWFLPLVGAHGSWWRCRSTYKIYKYSSEYPGNLVVLIVDSSIPSPACVSGLQLPPSLRSAAYQLGEQRATLASLDAHIYAGPWWHHRSSVVLPGLWPLNAQLVILIGHGSDTAESSRASIPSSQRSSLKEASAYLSAPSMHHFLAAFFPRTEDKRHTSEV